jgi:predicted neuraminidase
MTILLLALLLAADPAPHYAAELVFPLNEEHNHAPGIVECPNGDLLVSWYRGSGERSADDVRVLGSRKKEGSDAWSEPVVWADTPEFPDCNTALAIDPDGKLWLFYPTILANTWESCLTNFKVSSDYEGEGTPKWEREGIIFLKPEDFGEKGREILDRELGILQSVLTDDLKKKLDTLKERLGDKLYQRLGWQPRCKPTFLPSGRMLLPLYSDTFSAGIMAITDDDGKTWRAGEPLLGFGNIQPTVLRRDDGTLVAYMRENGPRKRIRISESKDDGETWGPVGVTDLPNPGAGVDGLRLANGHWILVYNDTLRGRSKLAISLSDDEGQTWPVTRHLEDHETGAYHYPAVTQGADGTIHVVYSYFVDGGKSMKHAAFNEAWIREIR